MGLPGGQGRLRREAGQPQRRRGPADGRGGPEVQPGRPGRHPAAEHAARPGRGRVRPRRASSARSAWPAPGSTRSASRSATASPARSPPASTTTSGTAPPRPAVQATGSTTTGTGSGTGAPASSATTASTASTSPAGAWASTPRSPSAPAAASTSSTTTRKSPTPRSSPGSSPTPASSGSTGCGRSTAPKGSGFGIAFYGDKGTLIIDDKGWRVEDGEPQGRRQAHRGGRPPHVQNFLDCVKSREKPERRHRDRPPQHPALPPRQHRPPRRPQAHLRRRQRVVPRRPRGQQAPLARVQQPVRDAVAGLTSPSVDRPQDPVESWDSNRMIPITRHAATAVCLSLRGRVPPRPLPDGTDSGSPGGRGGPITMAVRCVPPPPRRVSQCSSARSACR